MARVASVRLTPWRITPVVVVALPALCESVTTTVGHNENPGPSLRASNVHPSEPIGIGSVSKHVQVSPHRRQPLPAAGDGDIFDDNRLGPELPEDARELSPQSRAEAFFNPGPLAGPGDILARESPANEVNF